MIPPLKKVLEVESMLHVVQVCPEFPFHGGVERHVLELSRCLRNRQIDVTVVTSNPGGRYPGKETYENIKIVRLNSWNPNESYYFAPSLIAFLAGIRGSRTVVHSHNYQAFPALGAALAKRWNRVPLVLTPHYHPLGGTAFRSRLKILYHPVGKLVFDVSDVVIALSEYERSTLEFAFKLNSAKIRVIPAGLRRIPAGRRQPTKNILYVGRLERYKGVSNLIDCLPSVLQRVSTATLTIVGSGPDEERLRSAVSRKGISSCVSFLGNVSSSRLQELILTAGLVAMLSEYEAYSLIIGEALQRGVPVIATRVGPIPEIYGRDPKCVLLDYPPRIDELAKRIVSVLLGEPLGCGNKENLSGAETKNLANLSWTEVADRTVDLYEELL